MEENVALDAKKQKQFVKSIKGIKKLLKGTDKPESVKAKKVVQDGKVTKRKRKQRGLVYLSHIPHGFYEQQMTEYFQQFGVVTNARVIRSKRTGMSKGHAFVEFKDTNVAQIVAETMNNYLMGKRLIKAAYIPPEKQKKYAMRKNWNAQNNPGNEYRQKMKKEHNSFKDDKEELKIAKKLLSNLNKTKQKLHELDIDYDFFLPVDIPESLVDKVEVKKEKADETNIEDKKSKKLKQEKETQESKPKLNKKESNRKANKLEVQNTATQKKKMEPPASKKSKKALQKVEIEQSEVKNLVSIKDVPTKAKKEKNIKIEEVKLTQEKKSVATKETKINKAKQEQKQQKLKDAGVKLPEDFINVHDESNDDSDSDADFDSDEYEKMMDEDSDVNSGEGSDDLEDDDDDDDDDDIDLSSDGENESADEPTLPLHKNKVPVTKQVQVQSKKQEKKQNSNKPPPQAIHKKLQKTAAPKKPKFEKKGNKKTLNKVIKKRK